MNESTVQALCSLGSSRSWRSPGCFLQFLSRAFKQLKVGLLGALSHDEISPVQESAVPSNWPVLLEFEHLRIPFLCRCFLLSASGSRAEYKEGYVSLTVLSFCRAQKEPRSLLWLRVFLKKRPKGRKMPSKVPLQGLSIQHQ